MVPSTSAFAAERLAAPAPAWFPPAARALAGLSPRACRWPLGEPQVDGFGFCCVAVSPGVPYCAAHGAQARAKRQARAERQARGERA